MARDLTQRLTRLPLLPSTWEVGGFEVLTDDSGTVMVHAVMDRHRRQVRGVAPAPVLDVVIEAMARPVAPSVPGRPEAIVCSHAGLAAELEPLRGLVDLRVGPTPDLDAFTAAASAGLGQPPVLAPAVRLPEWRRLFAALVVEKPWARFDRSVELVYEGGALDGRSAEFAFGDPAGFVLLPEEDQIGVALAVTILSVDRLDAEVVQEFRERELVHGGMVPVVTAADGDGFGPVTPDQESELLDALWAAGEVMRRHAPALRSGEVVTAQVQVGGRPVGVTASLADDDESPEVLEALIPHEHLILASWVREPGGDAPLPRLALKFAAPHARDVARILGPIDRLLALPDEASDHLIVVGFEGAVPLGVVASLDPATAAVFDGADEALLAVSSGGKWNPVVSRRQIVYSRRVRLDRRPPGS